ncbi:PrsW family glutamic-type intramembrane protease [Gloeothece verrucosa]|uniref:FHA domain containing protein n=1 Tax=Gloeothece verrucosa (strain PCC 7822) TaxID=497965 RepID=E0UFR9_GLOV7|nr:PrsW family glutamic-type intramembrane protease [Gloeothece verrucosa]ADN13180.1 FHA domain containing protein [Gloeothece verrucosa PCC 7822]
MKNCLHCGSNNSDTARYCLNCGNMLASDTHQLTLHWRENGIEKTRSIDINDSTNKKAGTIRLGRDPDLCDIVLSDPKVSRLHSQITFNSPQNQFLIENLRENNPILINKQKLVRGSQPLNNGNTITLGDTQLRFMGNDLMPQVSATSLNVEVGRNPTSTLSISMLLPIISTKKDLRQQPYFVPGVITVIWVVLLLSSLGNAVLFNFLIALFLGFGGFYFIYKLCGKRKPWWVLLIPVMLTPILLFTPLWSLFIWFFRDLLPGKALQEHSGFLSTFTAQFFGAGLAEELFKALPLFILMGLSQKFNLPRLAIQDPLDGIVLGAASGLGFTLLETLGQYIPDAVQQGGELIGLQLLIVRIVGSVFGHMAYSGYFGYYIGLSVIKPRRRWKILATGYLIAATTHALWNTSALLGVWALGLVGILAFCLLTGAILRARKMG